MPWLLSVRSATAPPSAGAVVLGAGSAVAGKGLLKLVGGALGATAFGTSAWATGCWCTPFSVDKAIQASPSTCLCSAQSMGNGTMRLSLVAVNSGG